MCAAARGPSGATLSAVPRTSILIRKSRWAVIPPAFAVQRLEERDQRVDLLRGQPERTNERAQIRVGTCATVVVLDDLAQRANRAVVHIRRAAGHLPQGGCLEGTGPVLVGRAFRWREAAFVLECLCRGVPRDARVVEAAAEEGRRVTVCTLRLAGEQLVTGLGAVRHCSWIVAPRPAVEWGVAAHSGALVVGECVGDTVSRDLRIPERFGKVAPVTGDP